MARGVRAVFAAALVAGAGGCGGTAPATGDGSLIFAAASLRTALDEVNAACEAATGVTIRASYAATSALARQIDAGAPADVFISADTEWMDYVVSRGLIRGDSRIDLLTNTLVLIAPASRPPQATLTIDPGFALAAALGDGRLAVADPASVPAGKYARAALESLGVWASVESHLAPAEDVRAALRLVSRGEAPLGIVYRTDAAADAAVTVIGTFPAATHPPIVYPAALTSRATEAAARVLDCVRAPASMAVFARWGFGTPAGRQ